MFFNIINNITGEFYKLIQSDDNLLENFKVELEALKFENNVFACLWGKREFNGDKLKYKIQVSSIYNIYENDCQEINKIKINIENGEGFILSQKIPNTPFFDIGILAKINDNEWKLYLIQITKKKEPEERFTLTFLNDFFGYI